MNRVFLLATFLLISFQLGICQTQEEMAQKIQNYRSKQDAIRKPVIDKYNEFHAAGQADKPYEMQTKLRELREVSDFAIAEYAKDQGYFWGTKLPEAMSAYVKLFRTACDNELKQILDLYMKADRTPEDSKKVSDLEAAFNKNLEVAEDEVLERVENLFVMHWAELGNAEICKWMEAVLAEVPSEFEGFRGEAHPDLISAYYCKMPFPGARSCLCQGLVSNSVSVQVGSSREYEPMVNAQQAFYFLLRACMVPSYEYSRSGIKDKELIDKGEESFYEFYPKGAWQFKDREWTCKIALKKGLFDYDLRIEFSLPEDR